MYMISYLLEAKQFSNSYVRPIFMLKYIKYGSRECARVFYSSLVSWTKGWNGKKTETKLISWFIETIVLYFIS